MVSIEDQGEKVTDDDAAFKAKGHSTKGHSTDGASQLEASRAVFCLHQNASFFFLKVGSLLNNLEFCHQNS